MPYQLSRCIGKDTIHVERRGPTNSPNLHQFRIAQSTNIQQIVDWYTLKLVYGIFKNKNNRKYSMHISTFLTALERQHKLFNKNGIKQAQKVEIVQRNYEQTIKLKKSYQIIECISHLSIPFLSAFLPRCPYYQFTWFFYTSLNAAVCLSWSDGIA